jgi:hypothetical protein
MPSRRRSDSKCGRGATPGQPGPPRRPLTFREAGVWQTADTGAILLPQARMRLRSRTRIECGFRRRVQDRRLSRADSNESCPPPNLMCDRTIARDEPPKTPGCCGALIGSQAMSSRSQHVRTRTTLFARMAMVVFETGIGRRGLPDRPVRPIYTARTSDRARRRDRPAKSRRFSSPRSIASGPGLRRGPGPTRAIVALVSS